VVVATAFLALVGPTGILGVTCRGRCDRARRPRVLQSRRGGASGRRSVGAPRPPPRGCRTIPRRPARRVFAG
jgi:hypothetical protein